MTHELIGHPAPEFTLANQHGTPVSLRALRGAPVLVVFVPFAFSRHCTDELCEFRDNPQAMADAGVRVLFVSCDSVFTAKAWAEANEYPGDVLTDFWPHGAAAKAFGVFNEDSGMAMRGSFLIDADGVVRWAVVNRPSEPRSFDDAVAAVGVL